MSIYLVISSENQGKIAEIKSIFNTVPLTVTSFQDLTGETLSIVEDGLTFSENALKKVLPCPIFPNRIYLGDDSGLVVDALGGAPGIYSARYAGAGATSKALCEKILSELKNEKNRAAYFTCAIALKFPDNTTHVVVGKVHGHISLDIQGEKGFGYDPIFIPKSETHTFAQLSAKKKNKMSHRYVALEKARHYIQAYLDTAR